MRAQKLFETAPEDFFSFFHEGKVDGEKVVEKLDFQKRETAAASETPYNSVRFDGNMPSLLEEHLIQWATAMNLVGNFFKDESRTILWFRTPNPMLGGLTPREMIKIGRFKKLLKFILNAIDDSNR